VKGADLAAEVRYQGVQRLLEVLRLEGLDQFHAEGVAHMVGEMEAPIPLVELLERRSPGWLEAAACQEFGSAYASTARKLGKAALLLTEKERGGLATAGIDWPLDGWDVDELGRVILLLRADPEVVVPAFLHGDNRERQAVLKALPLLPDPSRWVPLGVEACRTNVHDVFEALCCENPFPAKHFPGPNFNQMVLKALFVGTRLSRIIRLAERITPELLRMVESYASERIAAGRTVPEDVECLKRMA